MSVTDSNVIVGKAVISVDSIDVGHTLDAVNVRLERDYLDVESQQRKGIVKKVKILEKMFVATTLGEATLSALKAAWDQAAMATHAETGSAYLGSVDTNEHTITIVGSGPNNGTRTLTIYRAVSVDAGEMTLAREEVSGVPVEFECLKSTDYTDANGDPYFGQIVDS